MKHIIAILFGMSSAITLQAAPTPQIMPFKGLHQLARHTIKAQPPTFNETYADFSGNWLGHCHEKEGDIEKDTTNEHYHIENNDHWIKIFDEDGADEFEIGTHMNEHKENENGFSATHLIFNWVNHSTLLLNLVGIESLKDSKGSPSTNTTSIRALFTLKKNDSLITQFEILDIENDEDSSHIIATCEYVRQ